ERGESLLRDVLDAARIERKVQATVVVTAAVVEARNRLRLRIAQSFQEGIERVRAVDQQLRRKRAVAGEAGNETSRADRAAVEALRDDHARAAARRGTVSGPRLPEVVRKRVAVLQLEVVIQVRDT